MKNVGIFVDVQNLFYCVGKKFEGKKLDYEKYLDKAVPEGDILYRALAYGSQVTNEADKFISCLQRYGYDPRYRKINDIKKCNWNVGITADVARMIDKLNIIVLGSSDPNLIPLIHYIQEHGARCIVFACGISREIKNNCDAWLEITSDLLQEKELGENGGAMANATEQSE